MIEKNFLVQKFFYQKRGVVLTSNTNKVIQYDAAKSVH